MKEPLIMDSESGDCALHGDWNLADYPRLLQAAKQPRHTVSRLDASHLTALDTAGATLLVRLLGADRVKELLPDAIGLPEERRALLMAVAEASRDLVEPDGPSIRWQPGDGLALLGRNMVDGLAHVRQFLNFMGLSLISLIRTIIRPRRWRVTAVVIQIHQTGFNALPIVALLNFLVGAVVAFLGATVLQQFGATIFTVDLVAYAFMRELGALLAAILLAGRTASAFTAQIGSMKVNEELDALRVQGLDPVEMLVLPRLLGLLVTLPLLTFVAVMAGMAGGALVALLSLDVSLTRFIAIVQEIPAYHLFLGLAKAPVFALVIALIGCLEGFKVTGSARSVGEHTTAAVVQSIFVVILLDAVAAMFYMEMGW